MTHSAEGTPRFGRVLTAMATPFDAAGDVNLTVAEKLADHLVTHGTETLVVCGTTGESPALSWDEEYALYQCVKQAVGDRSQVIAGTGSNSTLEAIEATQKAAKLGVDGTLQVVPYYNKPPQEGLYRHFSAIAESVPDLPVMLYNVPGRTSCNLLPETALRLADLDNVVAIKEASGNIDQVSLICRHSPEGFEVYSGDDSLTLPMLAVGAVGVVSVASHLVGDRMQQMLQAFTAGDTQTAASIHWELFPLFKQLFAETSPIPLKVALSLQGWQVGQCRAPLCSGSDELEKQMSAIMSQMDLLKA